jgi:hypothetical protein
MGSAPMNNYLTATAVAAALAISFAHADPSFSARPEWLDLRKGVRAFTGDDGGGATSLTVCQTEQAYTKWIDTSDIQACSVQATGVPVTVASDEIISIGTDSAPYFAVFIKADDSSWSGWTSKTGLIPRIPEKTKLKVRWDNAHLMDSDLHAGERLADGAALELISQDPKADLLQVRVPADGRTGWLFRWEVDVQGGPGLVLYPSSSTSVTYRFDCHAFVPRSHFYDTGNYSAALNEIEPLASPDCPEAEHLLGVMYGKGQGIQKDPIRAFALLLIASSNGLAPVGANGAHIPALGTDPNELEIVQFGATLTPGQLFDAERLAIHLDGRDAAAIRESMAQLQPRITRYNRQ